MRAFFFLSEANLNSLRVAGYTNEPTSQRVQRGFLSTANDKCRLQRTVDRRELSYVLSLFCYPWRGGRLTGAIAGLTICYVSEKSPRS